MTLRLREVANDEQAEVGRIARSHTLGAALVRRAQIVVHALGGLKAQEIATRPVRQHGSPRDRQDFGGGVSIRV
jgi:hypothetical protein